MKYCISLCKNFQNLYLLKILRVFFLFRVRKFQIYSYSDILRNIFKFFYEMHHIGQIYCRDFFYKIKIEKINCDKTIQFQVK